MIYPEVLLCKNSVPAENGQYKRLDDISVDDITGFYCIAIVLGEIARLARQGTHFGGGAAARPLRPFRRRAERHSAASATAASGRKLVRPPLKGATEKQPTHRNTQN